MRRRVCDFFEHLPQVPLTTPISQYELQLVHCCIERGFEKFEDLGVVHVGDQSLRIFR